MGEKRVNRYLIVPGCSDLNRGDQALVWETKRIAEECGFIGEFYLTSEQNEPVIQSETKGLEIVYPILEHTDKEINAALGELIAGNTGVQQEVQNYLVVTADVSAFYDTFERNQVYVEAGLFSMALVEALHYYGIGSCILQNGEYYKKNRKFKDICKNIPENERIILFVAIGYYKDEFSYAVSLRKNVEDVFVVK